jgi:hypothetical protein
VSVTADPPRPGAVLPAGVALAAAGALLQQVALIRVFSLAYWHHFAFVAVGLGLLGFGISGTALAALPGLRRHAVHTAAWAALATVPATGFALLAVSIVPFEPT